jgi:DNA-binding NtrC family response regulator
MSAVQSPSSSSSVSGTIEKDHLMINGKKRVMVVDDEDMVVSSLKTLLSLETPHEVLAFTSPQAALEAARSNAIDLAISDFLMPEMDGVAFLKEVRRLYPAIQLIILTGFADKGSAIRAINEVRLYQYLEKPWDNDDLIKIIEAGLDERRSIYKLQEYAQELETKIRLLERQIQDLRAKT